MAVNLGLGRALLVAMAMALGSVGCATGTPGIEDNPGADAGTEPDAVADVGADAQRDVLPQQDAQADAAPQQDAQADTLPQQDAQADAAPECQEDIDCPSQHCFTPKGKCYNPGECYTSDECPNGSFCKILILPPGSCTCDLFRIPPILCRDGEECVFIMVNMCVAAE